MVGCEGPSPTMCGSEAGSLGSDRCIELGYPPVGWTEELGLENPLDYQEDLISAVTGHLQSEGALSSEQAVPKEAVPVETTVETPQPVVVTVEVSQEQPVKKVPENEEDSTEVSMDLAPARAWQMSHPCVGSDPRTSKAAMGYPLPPPNPDKFP